MSKAVRAVRRYEAALLTAYQSFLKHLEGCVRAGTGRWAERHEREHAALCGRCLGEFLVAHPSFNFAPQVLKVVAARCGSPVPALRRSCCEALRKLFAKDEQGAVTLEAVKQIAKAVKDQRFSSPEDAVRTFASLKLEVHEDEDTRDPSKRSRGEGSGGTASKRQKKELKAWQEEAAAQKREIEVGLKEAESVVDPALRRHCMKETLKEVVVTYFRVLKQCTDASVGITGSSSSSSSSGSGRNKKGGGGGGGDGGKVAAVAMFRSLLPAALEGLAVFAHLINVDTVEDVLCELKLLLAHSSFTACIAASVGKKGGDEEASEEEDENDDDYDLDGGAAASDFARGRTLALPLDAALNCVRTAMRTLYGTSNGGGGPGGGTFGRELSTVDESAFVNGLFGLLPRLATEPQKMSKFVGGQPSGGPPGKSPGQQQQTPQQQPSAHATLAVECVEAALLGRRREYSTAVVAAFAHRLLVVGLALPDAASAAALSALTRRLLGKYPAALQLLEGDDDRVSAGGPFRPLGAALDFGVGGGGGGGAKANAYSRSSSSLAARAHAAAASDVAAPPPELTNPLSAAAWELALLKRHWHPAARAQAAATAALGSTGGGAGAGAAVASSASSALLSAAHGGGGSAGHVLRTLARAPVFFPPWKQPPASHPLEQAVKKQLKQQPRNRRDVFLRPTGDRFDFRLAVLAPEDDMLRENNSSNSSSGGASLASAATNATTPNPFKELFLAPRRFDLQVDLEHYQAVHEHVAEVYAQWKEMKMKQQQQGRSVVVVEKEQRNGHDDGMKKRKKKSQQNPPKKKAK